MKFHLIAIGGSIMHNLAISLQKAGHIVSGSDDEIYEPARSQLSAFGLLPASVGWNPDKITRDMDVIILGMHAKSNNPELIKAQQLELKVVSFPEYVSEQSKDKQRVVVCGSHGKTTTTSMILHVLNSLNRDFDYLVGARINGFETMVKISDAPLIIIEGDEYLSSSIDRVPKIWHYQPHISIITGVAWDHMNVFPTLDSYHAAFRGYLDRLHKGAIVYFDSTDPFLAEELPNHPGIECISYHPFDQIISEGVTAIHLGELPIKLGIFGRHNMANLKAAYLVLKELKVSDKDFARAISSFKGAAQRMQVIRSRPGHLIVQDFAHAPSKVKATVEAVKAQYPNRKLSACVELHTFSSLSKAFLPQYKQSMNKADHAFVFISDHTIKMKGMTQLTDEQLRNGFDRKDLIICRSKEQLMRHLHDQRWDEHNLLLMTSGNFEKMDVQSLDLH